MASQTGKWREEQILIVCPGSHTTMAQLGCGELTPPAHRFPTRMFRDEESDDWRPYHTEKRKKATAAGDGGETQDAAEKKRAGDEWEYVEDMDSDEGAVYPLQAGRIVNMEAFLAFLDHVHGTLTKTNHNTPIMLMISPQWTRPDCETVAQYVFERTKTPALCLIHSGVATQYGLRWPHMTVVDIGFEKVDVTCIYESRVVGYKNVGGVTGASQLGSATAVKDVSGGEVFTRKLLSLLRDKGFSYAMAEQLKKSPVCEVLPYTPDNLTLMELPADGGGGEQAAGHPNIVGAAEESGDAAAAQKNQDLAKADGAPEGDGKEGDEDGVLDVANIVVSGNTRDFLAKREKEKNERLRAAKKGKEKEAADAAGAKSARLPNARRTRNVFHYEETVLEDVPKPSAPAPAVAAAATASSSAAPESQPKPETEGAAAGVPEAKPPATEPAEGKEGENKENGNKESENKKDENKEGETKTESQDVEMADQPAREPAADEATKAEATNGQQAGQQEEKPSGPEGANTASQTATSSSSAVATVPEPAAPAPTERQTKRVRRDIEVGLERFLFADRREIDRIVTAIYRAVQGIEDMYMRPACWENLVFVGNGVRLRGLRDNILQTLQARHLVSPSSATMFTSELPSNLGTPSGTGSQTPTSSFAGAGGHPLPTTSSVNPLLQAATTGAAGSSSAVGGPGIPGGAPSSAAGGDAAVGGHHFHSQTPTSIKLAQLPTYLSEWTKNGFEESMFLGAQVAARLAFCIHNLDAQGLESQRLMSLSRVDYNELGPKGIRTHSMLG